MSDEPSLLSKEVGYYLTHNGAFGERAEADTYGDALIAEAVRQVFLKLSLEVSSHKAVTAAEQAERPKDRLRTKTFKAFLDKWAASVADGASFGSVENWSVCMGHIRAAIREDLVAALMAEGNKLITERQCEKLRQALEKGD